jgi:Rad3-related DNA helicase
MLLLTRSDLDESFPFDSVREAQDGAFDAIVKERTGILIEAPTGSGKSSIGMTALLALRKKGVGPLFYTTPTKALVEQIHQEFPDDTQVIMGRSEYPCLYYEGTGKEVNAMESPCYLLKCPHRVNQETGETEESGAEPCPYFLAKYRAQQGTDNNKIVVCTTAFFLLNRLLVPAWRSIDLGCVVIDEMHRLPGIARGIFEYSISDIRLSKLIESLEALDITQAAIFAKFRDKFIEITMKKSVGSGSLLDADEIGSMLEILEKIDQNQIQNLIRNAISDGFFDAVEQQTELKLLETMASSIPRFINLLGYSLPLQDREPLNYVYAYCAEDDEQSDRGRKTIRYQLNMKAYYVVPIIRRAVGKNVIAYSATISDPQVFGFETGLKLPFYKFDSEFDAGNTKVFMPTDTPNLATKKRGKDSLRKAMQAIREACIKFQWEGLRSLVVVISEVERVKMVRMLETAELNVLSYTNSREAKEALTQFKRGEGDVLVGTSAHYGEGIDLPKQIAPVIFFLRPGYQHPNDPMTLFEQKRFTNGRCWALWSYRVMIQALQVRGRNVRTESDMGVCIFVSQQFRRFLRPSLPEWLKPSYEGHMSMSELTEHTIKMLEPSTV